MQFIMRICIKRSGHGCLVRILFSPVFRVLGFRDSGVPPPGTGKGKSKEPENAHVCESFIELSINSIARYFVQERILMIFAHQTP